MVMDKGMEHRRISPKKKLYLPTPIIYPINYLAFSLLCAVKCWMAPKKGLLFRENLGIAKIGLTLGQENVKFFYFDFLL